MDDSTPGRFDQEKIVLLGESRVGKTSIIYYEVHGCAASDQIPTVGCMSSPVTVQIGDYTVVMHIWDTAGQEVYRSLAPIYVRGARIAVLVFDVTERLSFTRLDEWFDVVHECLPEATPVILVANKVDVEDSIAVGSDAIDILAMNKNVKCFRTSAITGEGVHDLFEYAAEIILRGALAKEPVAIAYKETDIPDHSCC
jgi:small GTP-binding protein